MAKGGVLSGGVSLVDVFFRGLPGGSCGSWVFVAR